MPIIYVEKTVNQTLRVPDGFKCDVCKKIYSEADYIERQEALHWTNFCGYGSVFGDGSVISLSICQSCLHDKFGEYINIQKDWEEDWEEGKKEEINESSTSHQDSESIR